MSDAPSSQPEGCPAFDRLEAFANGTQDDITIQEHVEGCDQCRSTVELIRDDDTVFLSKVADAIEHDPDTVDMGLGDVPGYTIHHEIHRGGQGVVYRARQLSTKRNVALKTLLRGTFAGPRQLVRFEREIEIVASMRHPNIVTVYDSGRTADGHLYLAMEYVDGAPLNIHLAHVYPDAASTLDERLALFCKIADAVAYAHQRGVIHRDLKPANILVDSTGEPRVLDFGLAKESGPTESAANTRAGEFLGTLQYAAPEQVSGDPDEVDTRTDIHALGIILFEMLTGRRPYDLGSSLADAVQSITSEEPPRPSSLQAALNHELDTILLQTLSKEKERRYQTIPELVGDIQRYRRGEPILAKSDSGWYVFAKTVSRHRMPFALSAAAVIALVVFGAWMTVLWNRATQAEAESSDVVAGFELAVLGGDVTRTFPRELTVLELLDNASRLIQDRFQDRPLVLARLRRALGNSYFNLGAGAQAEPHLEWALDVFERQRGALHPDTLNARTALAEVRRQAGRADQAEALIRESLSGWRRLQGRTSTEAADTLVKLSIALRDLQRFDEAERVINEAVAIYERPEHDETGGLARALHAMSILFALSERLDEAIETSQLAAELLAAHPEAYTDEVVVDFISLRNDVATHLSRADRFDEAGVLLRENLHFAWERLDPNHATLAIVQINYANNLLNRGHNEQALTLLLEAIAIFRMRPEAVEDLYPHTLVRVARGYSRMGNLEEASRYYAEGIALTDQILRDPFFRGHYRANWADCLKQLGNFDQALELLAEAYDFFDQDDEPRSEAKRRETASKLAGWLEAEGRSDEAARWSALVNPLP